MARPKKGTSAKDSQVKTVRLATVKIARKYFDTQENKLIDVGQIFVTSEERAKQLINAKVAELVSIKK